jgi:excisionase family DNA binding protein
MYNTHSLGQSILSERLLTVRQAAGYIKCSRTFLWQLRKKGKISSLSAGKKILICKDELDIFLKGEVSNA